MTSPHLDNTHDRTTSDMASHYRPWAAHTVSNVRRGMTSPPLDSTDSRQSRVWYAITALGQHTRSTTSGVALHNRLWAAHMVGLRRVWHNIIALVYHTRSNDVGCGMSSPPFDSTFRRTTSGVTCHHRRWAAHMVERCQAWHDITTLGLHARSDDVGRGMTSPPLDSTHGRMT